MTWIILLIVAYLIGSIPTSVWVGHFFYNTDVREHGSKNAGATNTFRILGKKAGSFVFLVDVAKGTMAVLIAQWFAPSFSEDLSALLSIGAGIMAFIGHVFPVFAGFRGGKGVATSLGVIIALAPSAALVSVILFLIIWFAFSYVSLGSIIGAAIFPWVQYFIYPDDWIITIFSGFLAIMIITLHKANILRLLAGIENKTNAFAKKKDKERDYEVRI